MSRALCTVAFLSWLSCGARGQSLNADWGDDFGTPDPSYAAAGLPGVWNSLDGTGGPHPLVDLNGQPTSVALTFEPPTSDFGFNHPETGGGDEALLDDAVGGLVDVVGRVMFRGLAPGHYRIITYAWIPFDPDNIIWVWINNQSSPQILGGPWPGGLEQGVTHAVHQATITDGTLRVYLVSGLWAACDWWLNGMQLLRLPWEKGDMNCDGAIDFGDINPFVLALSDPAGYAQQYPNCDINNGDINGSGGVGLDDINPFVALLSGR
jgi:hypothetical protein